MEQLEQNQAVRGEEVTQRKGTVEEIKRGMTQMLIFMEDFMDKEEKGKETQDQSEDIPDDGNPLLGYIPSIDPHRMNARSSKRVIRSHEEGETSQEGFIPTAQKEGVSRTVRIPANNPPKEDDYLDLQYGDVDNTNQAPPHMQTSPNSGEDSKDSGQIKELEERLKAVEGYNVFDVDTFEMSLVPDLTIPHKFKLEKSYIRSWNDLANTFKNKYKYNLDMAPNRLQLQNLSQKKDEAFKEYAQRWREMASRVQPPLLEKELVDMFMGTFQGPYYDKMVGSLSSGFSDLVVIGERIENWIKNGNIQGASSGSYHSKRPTPIFAKKKERETNAVVHQEPRPPMSFPQQQNRFQGPQRKFDPLPTSKSKVLRYLISESLVEIKPLAPPPPGKVLPRYNANERWKYHANSPGHLLEKCLPFRPKVQDLIESGAIAFGKPNVKMNPMPHHDGAVNAIEVYQVRAGST
ncbi:uncharacterized protein LOC131594434 [Vicia villosa]|uniref:uncharacterized protein LOC131594434 n=1 Tax=Vicia villosa TaxID=3911 RepID=UPI00273CAC46|nr:uncharacterized protein LOC131594434 [Vicia villosa]